MQNLTQEKKPDREVLSIDYFYERLTKKKKRRISLNLYKKIISCYLDVYFKDLYFSSGNLLYFPLGGYMKKVAYSKWVYKMKRGSQGIQHCKSDQAIGLFWFLRPSKKMYWMTKLKKLTGIYSKLAKLDKLYSQNNDKDLLPIFTTEVKKGNRTKTLYKCILT